MNKKLFLLACCYFTLNFINAQCNELFFSEYIEGTGNDKVIEIYNPSNAAINLSNYKILLKGFSGSPSFNPSTGSFSLSGTIASKGTYVICHVSASPAILAKKDTAINSGGGSIMNMNGDDALILVKNNIDTIDVIGNRFAADTSQAFTSKLSNKQLIRKNTINQGTINWGIGQSQWNINAVISTNDLKLHTIVVCGGIIDTFLNYAAPSMVFVDENVGTISIQINSNLPASPLTLQATATLIKGDPTDINGYTPVLITIPAGSTTASFNVTVTDDAILEDKDTFLFKLTSLLPGSTKLGFDSIYTLIINPSDRVPVNYPIGTIRGNNFIGLPDSVNYSPIILTGTVYGIDIDTTIIGIRFVIRDQTGGILVSSFNKNWNYTVNQGDSIQVQGKISHWSGWGSIENLDTLIVLKTSTAIKASITASILNENTESNLVKLNNVYISPCSPWPSSGIANVDVTDGIQTYTLRLLKAQNFPRPTTRFDLTGLGGQFDNTSPFTSGYQLYPRNAADFVSNGNPVPQPPLYAIATIKVDNNNNGITDSIFTVCKVRGTVVGLATGTGATNVIIKSGGKGIKIFSSTKTFGLNLVIGDSIEVAGRISDNFGWAEITTNVCGDTIIKLGTGIVESPTVITSLGESNESDLVRLNGLNRVTGSWNNNGNSFNTVKDASGTLFTVKVQNFGAPFGTTDLLIGTFDIIGLVGQNDTTSNIKTKGYQIIPRFKADIIKGSSLRLIPSENINIYPNPTTGLLYVETKLDHQNSDALIKILTVTGQLVYSGKLQSNLIDLKNLDEGQYILEYISNDEKIVKKFLKQ